MYSNHCRKGCLSLPLNNKVFAYPRNGGKALVKLKNAKLQYPTSVFSRSHNTLSFVQQ